MREFTQLSKDLLEGMVDDYGLVAVLETLSAICAEKADHIRSNGGPGDWLLADTWDDAGAEVERASGDGDVKRVTMTTIPRRRGEQSCQSLPSRDGHRSG